MSELVYELVSYVLEKFWPRDRQIVDVFQWYHGINAILHDFLFHWTALSPVPVIVLLGQTPRQLMQAALDARCGGLGWTNVQYEVRLIVG